MKPRRSPIRPTCWLGRLLRGWRLDRNPLRRGPDRTQTVVLAVLAAAFLAGTPFAAQAAGGWIHVAAAREAQVQQTKVHQVPATLLQAAAQWDGYQTPDSVARWRVPDGQLRTGPVLVPGGASAGSTVLVWINQAGQLAEPPLQRSQIAGRVQLVEGLTVAGLAVVLILAGLLACRILDRRRMAAWDADWLAHGPRWSPHR